MKYGTIALVMAMKEEALPIIKHFKLVKDSTFYPIEVYANKDKSLILSLNGKSTQNNVDNIGTQAAAINTFVLLNNYKIDLVINCGTAGGFYDQGTDIADVFISNNNIIFHNRNISINTDYDNYGLGKYPCVNLSDIAGKLGAKLGRISSGDSFDLTESDLKVMRKNNTNAKEMEAASVAWVCSLLNVDFTSVKVITDFVDKPTNASEDFISNFNKAVVKLKETIINLIEYLT